MGASPILIDPTTPLLPACPQTWAGTPHPPDTPSPTGTIFSSAMNLSACALGASMLSLPYTMQLSGPIVALEFLTFFAILSFFSAQAIVSAGIRCRKTQYPEIIAFYFGPVFGLIAQILLCVALIVAAISYVVALADLLPDMLPFITAGRTMRIFATVSLLYPATLVTNLSSFGPASFVAASGCYALAASLVAQLFVGGEWRVPKEHVWTDVNVGGLVYSLPMICFVYAFHYVLTETLCELEEPSRKRMALVNAASVATMFCCYLPVSVAGYLVHSGVNIGPNVLSGGSGFTAVIAKWSIGGLLLITYALFIIPLRKKLEGMVVEGPTKGMLDVKRVGIAAVLNLIVAVTAVSLRDLGVANTIAGGCTALIMFYFPGRLMVENELEVECVYRDVVRVWIGRFFTGLGLLICFVGLFGGTIFDY